MKRYDMKVHLINLVWCSVVWCGYNKLDQTDYMNEYFIFVKSIVVVAATAATATATATATTALFCIFVLGWFCMSIYKTHHIYLSTVMIGRGSHFTPVPQMTKREYRLHLFHWNCCCCCCCCCCCYICIYSIIFHPAGEVAFFLLFVICCDTVPTYKDKDNDNNDDKELSQLKVVRIRDVDVDEQH